MQQTTLRRLDRVGSAVSSLCAVHCLLVPFLLGALPVVGLAFLIEPAFEWTIIGASALIGVLALGGGAKRHGAPGPLVAFALGLGLFVVARLLEHAAGHAHVGDAAHHGMRTAPWLVVTLSVLGGIAIVAAHLWNTRLVGTHAHTCHDHDHGSESDH